MIGRKENTFKGLFQQVSYYFPITIINKQSKWEINVNSPTLGEVEIVISHLNRGKSVEINELTVQIFKYSGSS